MGRGEQVARRQSSYIAGSAIGIGIVGIVLFIGGYLPFDYDPAFSPEVKNEHTETIVLGTINVAAEAYEVEEFVVPPEATKPILRGSFLVSGGEEIHVMVLDEVDFVGWQARGVPERIYYTSGPVVAADLEADLPPGETLFLIFDNTFTLTSPKIINAEVELAYLQ
jgi:hypothetical protein